MSLQAMEVNGGSESPLQAAEDVRVEPVCGPEGVRECVGKATLEQVVEAWSAWQGVVLEKVVEG